MPVIYEERQVLAGGRYLQQIRISAFPPSADYPQGLRYSLCLIDRIRDKMVLLYDIHELRFLPSVGMTAAQYVIPKER